MIEESRVIGIHFSEELVGVLGCSGSLRTHTCRLIDTRFRSKMKLMNEIDVPRLCKVAGPDGLLPFLFKGGGEVLTS